MALSGLCRRIILSARNPGIETMKSAGTIAKYFATSLAIENVVSVPRVINSCLPISTISINLVDRYPGQPYYLLPSQPVYHYS